MHTCVTALRDQVLTSDPVGIHFVKSFVTDTVNCHSFVRELVAQLLCEFHDLEM